MKYRTIIIAILASLCVVATAGAATHYLITSTKQIKPSVVAQLKGNRGYTGARGAIGPRGATGVAGSQGATGAQGPQGPPGTAGAQGAKGDTGATGPQGQQGPQGAQGDVGPSGTSIVARLRSSDVVLNSYSNACLQPPYSGCPLTTVLQGTWTQAGNEVDRSAGEHLDVTVPTDCNLPSGNTSPYIILSDGADSDLFEPGAPRVNTWTMKAVDFCQGPGHVTVNSAAVDIEGIR
jgi:hypothetical protein